MIFNLYSLIALNVEIYTMKYFYFYFPTLFCKIKKFELDMQEHH